MMMMNSVIVLLSAPVPALSAYIPSCTMSVAVWQ